MSNKDKKFICPSFCLTGSVDQLNLKFSGYSSHFHGAKAAAVLKLTAHRHLVMRFRMSTALLALSDMAL
jgi:hypothetical protein